MVSSNFDPSSPNPPDANDPRLQSRATPPPQAPQPQTPDDWEHQFRSLKGRYDREQEDKRRLSQQVIDMQRLMAQVGVPSATPEGSVPGLTLHSPLPGKRVTQKRLTSSAQS